MMPRHSAITAAIWRIGKSRIAEIVSGIDDLDADRAGVDVGLARPGRHAGVPGAARLRHELHDAAVLVDEVMARHPRLGVAQPIERRLGALHAGVVQQDDVGVRRPRARRDWARGRRSRPGWSRARSRFMSRPMSKKRIDSKRSMAAAANRPTEIPMPRTASARTGVSRTGPMTDKLRDDAATVATAVVSEPRGRHAGAGACRRPCRWSCAAPCTARSWPPA